MMIRTNRLILVAPLLMVSAASLTGCMTKKVPPFLLTLTSAAAAPASMSRTAAPGEAIIIDVPVVPKELASTRVPALAGPSAVAYIKDLQWVDAPDKLFQDLLQETTMRMTNRVVIDPRQSSIDAGLKLSGNLTRFDYDTAERSVIVRYDGALATAGGTRVETRPLRSQDSRRRNGPHRWPSAQPGRQPGCERSGAMDRAIG